MAKKSKRKKIDQVVTLRISGRMKWEERLEEFRDSHPEAFLYLWSKRVYTELLCARLGQDPETV